MVEQAIQMALQPCDLMQRVFLKYEEGISSLDPVWDSIAPSTEENRLHSIAEVSEQLTVVSQQDMQDNQNILSESSMHVRFESAANKQEILPEQYRQYMRELNDQQKSIVMFHRDWCKKAVLSKTNQLSHTMCSLAVLAV